MLCLAGGGQFCRQCVFVEFHRLIHIIIIVIIIIIIFININTIIIIIDYWRKPDVKLHQDT